MTTPPLTRRDLMKFAPAALCCSQAFGQSSTTTRSFWVLGLLDPTIAIVSSLGTSRLHCTDAQQRVTIIEANQTIQLGAKSSQRFQIAGPDGSPVDYMIEVPGVIRRAYFGTCNIRSIGGTLVAVATMDVETAAGSIVGAELPVTMASFDAMAAQAIAARSVLLGSRPRHHIADFCDTTHCQFLRSPAQFQSQLELAIVQTTGIVLKQNGRVMPARYSAACGGYTQGGMDGRFEYLPAQCEICKRSGLIRRGHGWGLCQEGAMGLARMGWSWKEILGLYYPNVVLATWP